MKDLKLYLIKTTLMIFQIIHQNQSYKLLELLLINNEWALARRLSNVIFDDSSASVTIELEPLFYSEDKINLIHDRIFEFAIDSDVIELIKYYFKVYYCPKCNEQLFFVPVNNTKNCKYHCDRCNEYYDAKDIINGLEEIIIRD